MPECKKLPLKLSTLWESFHSIVSAEVGLLGQPHLKYSQYHPQWMVPPSKVVEVTKNWWTGGTVTGQCACNYINIYETENEKYICVCVQVHIYVKYINIYSPVTIYTQHRIFHNRVCQKITFTQLFYFVLSFLNEHWTTLSAHKNFYFSN